jgi:hypothetical protein
MDTKVQKKVFYNVMLMNKILIENNEKLEKCRQTGWKMKRRSEYEEKMVGALMET